MSEERERQIRELLEDFVPNLLTEVRNECFVRNLFALEKGNWYSVRDLCDGVESADTFFATLSPLIEGDLVVVWLECPGDGDGDYGYVHFHLPDVFWTSSAIYNVRRLFA